VYVHNIEFVWILNLFQNKSGTKIAKFNLIEIFFNYNNI
jgi:hypothetical protein